ncbi:hypothetical protein LOAG_11727 [Loa loa]|uniref:Uncharacterized protein n=1 Tax=Loa loa TaxID=7209 RepID=A0A1S0TMM3_LOALO|nr:hypothetical protein LOAG_11727 [Loa loa]EFO16775.1 hypothetical protein LOAG_11727 [Loa loa]
MIPEIFQTTVYYPTFRNTNPPPTPPTFRNTNSPPTPSTFWNTNPPPTPLQFTDDGAQCQILSKQTSCAYTDIEQTWTYTQTQRRHTHTDTHRKCTDMRTDTQAHADIHSQRKAIVHKEGRHCTVSNSIISGKSLDFPDDTEFDMKGIHQTARCTSGHAT